MADVFISYARGDRGIAVRLARHLSDEGLSVFFDVNLRPGDAWDRRIEEELLQASAVVVIWSESSVDRQWVRNEARFALRRNMLFPVRIDTCEPPLEFSHCQTEDLCGVLDEQIQDRAQARERLDGLIRTIRDETGIGARAPDVTPAAVTTAPTRPARSAFSLAPKANCSICGIGGAGGNMLQKLSDLKPPEAACIAVNTDAVALDNGGFDWWIQLGPEITEGRGANGFPNVGAASAEASVVEIVDQIAGARCCLILAGMGGGTGTGAAPIFAQAARELGCATFCIVTMPFHFEGEKRKRQAEQGIAALGRHGAIVIVIENQKLFLYADQSTTFSEAFNMIDELAAGIAKSIVAKITQLQGATLDPDWQPPLAEIATLAGLKPDIVTVV